MATITVTGLNRAAEKYDPVLRLLPFVAFITAMQEMQIQLIETGYKDILIEWQRKSGLLRPYVVGNDPSYGELGKMTERELITQIAYAALKDNINNYRTKQVLYDPAANIVNNKTKKHPLEQLILVEKVKTVAEDMIFSIFQGERNDEGNSPVDCWDGFDTLITADLVSGLIAADLGNYVGSGAMNAPTDATDYSAWTNLVAWLRQADALLKKSPCALYIPNTKYLNARDALNNKLINKSVEFPAFLEHLRDAADIPQLQLVKHYALGNGGRMSLQALGNMTFGMSAESDRQFVKVRDPFEDPNEVQFWVQIAAGCRVNSVHRKKFMMNDGVPSRLDLSGDYVS